MPADALRRPNAQIDAHPAASGLRPAAQAVTFYWRVVVYERPAAAWLTPASSSPPGSSPAG